MVDAPWDRRGDVPERSGFAGAELCGGSGTSCSVIIAAQQFLPIHSRRSASPPPVHWKKQILLWSRCSNKDILPNLMCIAESCHRYTEVVLMELSDHPQQWVCTYKGLWGVCEITATATTSRVSSQITDLRCRKVRQVRDRHFQERPTPHTPPPTPNTHAHTQTHILGNNALCFSPLLLQFDFCVLHWTLHKRAFTADVCACTFQWRSSFCQAGLECGVRPHEPVGAG